MRSCIITGAGGLIGSYLVRELAPSWHVHAVRRRPGGQAGAASIEWLDMDLARDTMLSRLPKAADAVIYLAQSEHFREFPERALDIFEVNVAAVARMLDYARRAGAQSFVLASSGGVYGSSPSSLSEDTPIPAQGDLGFYLSTKLCSEIVARNYSHLLNIVILRMFFVYGPGQRRSMLVPRLIDNIRHGRPIILQGEDGIVLNPTHVSDAVRAIEKSLSLRGGHTINVGGPQNLSLREISNIIGRLLGRKPEFSLEPSAQSYRIVGDIGRMSEMLAAPVVRFEDGARTVLDAEPALLPSGR